MASLQQSGVESSDLRVRSPTKQRRHSLALASPSALARRPRVQTTLPKKTYTAGFQEDLPLPESKRSVSMQSTLRQFVRLAGSKEVLRNGEALRTFVGPDASWCRSPMLDTMNRSSKGRATVQDMVTFERQDMGAFQRGVSMPALVPQLNAQPGSKNRTPSQLSSLPAMRSPSPEAVSARSDADASSSLRLARASASRNISKISTSQRMGSKDSFRRSLTKSSSSSLMDDLGGNRLPNRAATAIPTSTAQQSSAEKQIKAMKEVLRLQKEVMMPLDSFQFATKQFKEHAHIPDDEHFTEGTLAKDELGIVMRKLGFGQQDDENGKAMIEKAFHMADKDHDSFLSFREFMIWFSSHSFKEDINVDPQEVNLRRLSKKFGIPAYEMDTYKRNFDEFDLDGSGMMDRDEFYEMLLKCLKVPRHIGMPASRVQQLWKAADLDGSGEIDFEEFVVFYSKYFMLVDGSSGIDQYYSRGSLANVLWDGFM